MAITNEFRDAVKAQDVRMLRIMLKDSLVVDPTFAEFGQMMKLADGIPGLFDPHDGETMNYDKTVWTKNYMDEQMVRVIYNFSEERLDLLKSICGYLYKDRAQKKEQASAEPGRTTDRKKAGAGAASGNKARADAASRKKAGVGVAVAGAAVAAVGVAASKPLVIGAGAAVAAVGIYIIYR